MATESRTSGFFVTKSAVEALKRRLLGNEPILAQHFKGGTYRVTGVVFDASRNEDSVKYILIGHPKLEFVRTPEDFFGEVFVGGKWVPRFDIREA